MSKARRMVKLKRRSTRPDRPLSDEEKAANRRKLLSELDEKTAEFTRIQFAKLGLYQ